MSSTQYTVCIDSRDRNRAIYAMAGEYTVKLPRTYTNVERVELVDVQVPTSFYVFDATIPGIRVNLYSNSGTVLADSKVISLPVGNYNSSTLITALQNAMYAAFYDLGVKFTVVLDPTTLLLTFTNDSYYMMEFDTTTTHEGMTDWGLGYILGFAKNALTTKAMSITSPNTINLNPVTYLYLAIDPLNHIDIAGRDGADGTEKYAFAKIPLPDVSFNITYLDSKLTSFPPAIMTPPLAKLERLNVAWRKHDGSIVDFNDSEHSFQLRITCCDRVAACKNGRVLNTAV